MEIINMLQYKIFVDSCALYPPLKEEKSATEKLWELYEKGTIQLEFAEATDEEIQKAPPRVRNIIHNIQACKITWKDMLGEGKAKLTEIEKLLFPHKEILNDNEKKDVRNLFCAQKYGCRIFITFDKKHILDKGELIKQKLKMTVATPIQCLNIVLDRMEWLRKHTETMKRLKNGQ